MEHNVLFKTIHGSRLYGLSHEGSDWDYYTVVETVAKKKATYSTHSIVDGVDSVVVDYGTWVNACQAGTPQALEAMFAQEPYVLTDHIGPFRAAFRGGTEYNPFLRTIKAMSYEHGDSYKHKRHMLRLGLEMKHLRAEGRFNPTLNRLQIELINSLAKLPAEHVYNDALALAWS